MGSIQSLLNAATLLEREKEGGKGESVSWRELWSADNRYTPCDSHVIRVKVFEELKRPHTQCNVCCRQKKT